MKAAQMVVVVCFLSALAGCGPTNVKTATMPVTESHLVSLTEAEKEGLMPGNDPASIAYVTLDRKPILVVWSDAPSCSHGVGISSSGPTTPHGELIYRESDMKLNREIAYSGEIYSSEKGKVTIDGEIYDLVKGDLFLVSGVGGEVQVKQLKRDLSELKFEPNDLVTFGKADPEITTFFSKPAKTK